jgi:hypothetical protein
LSWDYVDGKIPSATLNSVLVPWLESLNPEIKDITEKRVSNNKTYYFAIIECQNRALKFAKENNYLVDGHEPKYSATSKGIILWSIDQGADTKAPATEIAKKFQLKTCQGQFDQGYEITFEGDFPDARYMHDVLGERREGDYVFRLVGDDRGWGEGAYYLYLYYNNAEVDRVLELEGCGI